MPIVRGFAAGVVYAVLAMLALPAAAQTLPPGDAIGCACLKRSVDDARADWTTRQGALDAANAELARLDNQLAAARAGLDVNNPQAVAQFRQLLAQRDSAAERSRGELVASAQAANARYNATVGDYNGNCAGRPVPPPPPGPLTCPR